MPTIFVDPIVAPTPAPGVGRVQNVIRYYGDATTPQDVRRRRKQVQEAMRRFGTPVLIKKMLTTKDVTAGVAQESANRSSIYKQTRHNDPLSHGVGFVSLATSPTEWVAPNDTAIVISDTSPGPGYTPAPLYRGYGQGFLTYIIMPDVAEDIYKVTETGVFFKVQDAKVQMGWYPEVNDNDLMILVELDRNENIVESHERYLLRQTNPISMRGLDRRGRRERETDYGNRHVVNQTFDMTLIPDNEELYKVEIDR
jgi:hypothetical protein